MSGAPRTMGRGVGAKTEGPPSAGHNPSAPPRAHLIIAHAFSPQALQSKTASDQVGASQGSGEAQGRGADLSCAAACLSCSLWSRCETPEAR